MMKKASTLIMALFISAMASFADITIHDVTFTSNLVNGPHTAASGDSDKNYQVVGAQYVGSTARNYGGFYVADGSGLKFNFDGDTNVTYLYIGSSVKITTDSIAGVNKINWSNANRKLNIASGGWVDVDASYTLGINLGNMTAGDIYLNSNGRITSAMNTGFAGTIHAVLENGSTPVLCTRTLVAGNFSGRDLTNYNFDFGGYELDTTGSLAALTANSSVEELNPFVGKYIVSADSEGIKVTYVMPEPSTATLSLLALAGLAARRRRK